MLPDNHNLGYAIAGMALLLLCAGLVLLWQRVRLQKAQEAANESRRETEQMEHAYANAPLGLATLDRKLRYIRINKFLAEMNGLSVKDHIGKTLREVVPDVAPKAEQPFLQVLETGEPLLGLVFEGTTIAHPGTPRSWRESVYPVFASDGKVIGINVAVEEITEERRLSAALHASEQRERERAAELEAVMNATPAGIFIAHDVECLHIIGNPEANRMLRLRPGTNASADSRSNSGRRAFTETRNGTPVPANELPMQVAAMTGKEVRGVELEYHFHGGDIMHALVNAAPLRNARGEVFGAVGAFIDVTAQKEAQQDLLQESRRKDEFLATLAHELRNPLAAIQNGLELIKLTPPTSPSLTRTHGIMERQLVHLIRLIDDLLDVSRISSGKFELKKETVDVRTIIDDALGVSRAYIESFGHELEVHLSSTPLYVDGDLVRLAQVVNNLLNNAAKYTPEGGVIILTVEQQDGSVVIRVVDNGIGIEEGMLQRLFNIYSQLEKGRERRQGGIGIGLSLAKRIVELHGGTLTAESAGTGKGSTFTVCLPRSERDDKHRPAIARSADQLTSSDGKRILVVDDNMDAAHALCALLEMGGHTVRLAYTGQDAMKTAKSFQPEIAFVDIGLPDMSGLEVARALRAEIPTENARLVALTGWGSEKDRLASLDSGFDFHVTKPATIDAIREILPDMKMPSSR